MIKKQKGLYVFLICFGIIFLAIGIIVVLFDMDKRYSGIAYGIAGASIALGIVGLVGLNKKPELIRQGQINEKDERSIKIREKSAYANFFVTMLSLTIVLLVFVWLDYHMAYIILSGVTAIHIVSYFLFINYYNKKY